MLKSNWPSTTKNECLIDYSHSSWYIRSVELNFTTSVFYGAICKIYGTSGIASYKYVFFKSVNRCVSLKTIKILDFFRNGTMALYFRFGCRTPSWIIINPNPSNIWSNEWFQISIQNAMVPGRDSRLSAGPLLQCRPKSNSIEQDPARKKWYSSWEVISNL